MSAGRKNKIVIGSKLIDSSASGLWLVFCLGFFPSLLSSNKKLYYICGVITVHGVQLFTSRLLSLGQNNSRGSFVECGHQQRQCV